MNNLTIAYGIYIVLTAAITIWVANYLFKNGKIFLYNAFKGNEALADAINNLLKMGFYLVNIGYAFSTITISSHIYGIDDLLRVLAIKIGLILLILGGMHFFNMFILYKVGAYINKRQEMKELRKLKRMQLDKK